MSASQVSISQLDIPRHGTVTLFGYGIDVRVNRGHLVIEDGIAADRRRARIPRVGHGLKRLVVIGSDGVVSLAALRWLADQDAAFVMLERDGSMPIYLMSRLIQLPPWGKDHSCPTELSLKVQCHSLVAFSSFLLPPHSPPPLD
jgi:hypothetical protein